MSNANALPSEVAAIVATIDPDAYTAATTVSDYASMADFESIMFIILVGTVEATATIDAVIKQATDSSGTGAKNLTTSKAITQLVATDDDVQVIVNVRSEDLDLANNFDYVAISVTGGTAAADYGVVALGMNARHGPASDNDLASVDEIVS